MRRGVWPLQVLDHRNNLKYQLLGTNKLLFSHLVLELGTCTVYCLQEKNNSQLCFIENILKLLHRFKQTEFKVTLNPTEPGWN